jgi:hypothetical protein
MSNPTNPQTWNLYAYVMNNPVSLTDPTGLDNCNGEDDLTFHASCGDGAPDPLTISPGTMSDSALNDIVNVNSDLPTPAGPDYSDLLGTSNNAQFGYQTIPGSPLGNGDVAMGWIGQAIFNGPGMSSFWNATNSFINQSMVSMAVGGVTGGVLGHGLGQFIGGFLEGYSAEATTTVGRWMFPSELNAMRNSGLVQEGTNGVTHVTVPPNLAAWTPKSPGRVFAQFDVPSGCIRCVTSNSWGYIYGPSSRFANFYGITGMPPAINIVPWEF